MATKRFKAELLEGHKAAAVEVRFDPSVEWKLDPAHIRPGRHGFPVHASLNRTKFDSFIVPRQRRFWLEIPEDVRERAKVAVGDVVSPS